MAERAASSSSLSPPAPLPPLPPPATSAPSADEFASLEALIRQLPPLPPSPPPATPLRINLRAFTPTSHIRSRPPTPASPLWPPPASPLWPPPPPPDVRQPSAEERMQEAQAAMARMTLLRMGIPSPPTSVLFSNKCAVYSTFSEENPLHESHDGTNAPPSDDEAVLRRLYVHLLRAALDGHSHRACCERSHQPHSSVGRHSRHRRRALSPPRLTRQRHIDASSAPSHRTSHTSVSEDQQWMTYARRLPWPREPSPPPPPLPLSRQPQPSHVFRPRRRCCWWCCF